MRQLEFIYYVEPFGIYPFLKEKSEECYDYYRMKEARYSDYDESLREQMVLVMRMDRYLLFLNKGYSYEEISEFIYEGIEKMANRRNLFGVEQLYHEKEALDIALELYQSESQSNGYVRGLNKTY